MCTFDSVGSGLSDGDFVTLGLNEADDLFEVVNHLYISYGVNNIILWGRSMGACSALVFMDRYYSRLR